MNLSKIDLNLLVTFEMLISEGSVSRTAQKLGVTQPAVSHSLKRLRDLLGDELLVRGPRGLQPTMRAPGGRAFDPEHHGSVRSGCHTSHIPDVDERRHER